MKKKTMDADNVPGLFARPWLMPALLAVLFLAALGIRLFDLTDLPNDFYMVRQYRSIIIARGMYYSNLKTAPEWQREMAVAQWKGEGLIEPPIMEALAALTYHVTGEHIWMGRVYAALFWLAGGVALWLLAREMSMRAGGLIALAYFLFAPFAVTVSRAFLPDPLMIALIAWALWALFRWEVRRTWKAAILAGILTGLAILVKSFAGIYLLGGAAGLVLSRGALKRIVTDKQVWAVAGITALPVLLYYLYGLVLAGTFQVPYAFQFFPTLLKDPSFYGRWIFMAAGFSGFAAMFASLTGILLFPSRNLRLMTLGLWIGYVVCGFAFPYAFLTHEYYHLPLILIVAIGLIPVADFLVRQVAGKPGWQWRAALAGILLFGVVMKMWESRNSLVVANYRDEASYWQELGRKIGQDSVIELSGDYGYRLEYWGWVTGAQWATTGDMALRTLGGQGQPDFSKTFAERTAGKDLFVVTSGGEWQTQSELREYVTAHYQLIDSDEGDGYWIFDLHQPVNP